MKYCMGCMEPIDDSVIVCRLCGYHNDDGAAAPLFIKPGSILANRYIVGKNLSYDKTTALYIAQDAYESCKVLIKEFLPEKYINCRNKNNGDVLVMSPQYEAFDKERSAFLFHEKKIKAVVKSDAVLKCLEVIEDMNTVYAVCSYSEVTTLTEHIRRNGKYSEEGAINALLGVMHGVDKLHENDIKLGNITTDSIFVNGNGELKLWKYEPTLETGIKPADTAKFGRKKIIPLNEYAAPEMLESVDQISIRSDVYSIAAVLYDMMCGTPPASAAKRLKRFNRNGRDVIKSPKKFIRDIKPDHETALLNALALSPDNRTKDIECFISELTSGVSIKRVKEKSNLPFFNKLPLFVKIFIPLVFITAIVLGQVYVHKKSGYVKPEGIGAIPEVTSMDSGIAANYLKKKGFSMQVTGISPSDMMPSDTVLTQEPLGGIIAPLNSTVFVTVSKYSEMLDMPFVRGGDVEEAKKRLEAMGFIVEIDEATDDVIAPGCVVEQKPAAIVDGKYNRVPFGSTVKLTKSLGRSDSAEVKEYTVNRYVDLTFDEAYEQAKHDHALLKVTSFRLSKKSKSVVLEQKPEPQEKKLDCDAVIELAVSKGCEEFQMPDVTCMTKEQAEAVLNEYSMKINFEEKTNSSFAAGLVFEQTIPAGNMTAPESDVTIRVSLGPEQVEMINVVGMNKSDALKALGEVGLGAEVSYEHTENDADEDKVTAQDPDRGKRITKGSKVSITVSTGAELIQVPNVMDKAENEAKKILTDAGFRVDSRSDYGQKAVGSIMSQSPEAGQQAKKGDTVSVVVCKGEKPQPPVQTSPAPEPIPDPDPETTTTPATESMRPELSSWVDGHIKPMRLPNGSKVTAVVADNEGEIDEFLSELIDYWDKVGEGGYDYKFVNGDDSNGLYMTEYHAGENGGQDVIIPAEIDGRPVVGIPEGAFVGCHDTLRSVTIESNPGVEYTIGDFVFAECENLTRVVLPENTVSIGRGAFRNCAMLYSINLPDSIREIGDGAFMDCASLGSVVIPPNVVMIDADTFNGCKILSSVTLPASLQVLKERAFHNCPMLKSLYVPSSVTYAGSMCFGYSSGSGNEEYVKNPDFIVICDNNSWIKNQAAAWGLKVQVKS